MSRWENVKEYLNTKYRLILLNDSTLEERLSFRLSRANVYTVLSTFVVLYTAAFLFVLINTPLKTYIPGYQDVQLRRDLERLAFQTDSLQERVEYQRAFIGNIQDLLGGNLDEVAYMSQAARDEAGTIGDSIDVSSIDLDSISPEDSILRDAVETESAFSLGGVSARTTRLDQMHFIRPLEGFVNRGFQADIEHYGLDIGTNSEDAPVKAVLDGVVVLSEWTAETGYVIGVQHTDNLLSFYKHNSELLKKVGNFVSAGDAIAIVGNTGELTTGPHLHFELWHNRSPVNPLDYINY